MSVSPNSSNTIDQITRTTQIIIAALISGVTIFLLVVVGLIHFAGFGAPAKPPVAPGQAAGPNAPGTAQPASNAAGQNSAAIPILTYLSAAVALTLLPLSFILPNVIASQTLRKAAAATPSKSANPNPSASPGVTPGTVFQASAIFGAALTEGPAFLAGIAYLIEQNPIALVVFLVALATLILRFPTRDRVERWIANHQVL